MMTMNTYKNLSKRERLQITRERAKLEKNLGSIADMTRLPAALFVVDINKEKIAVAEARKLNIPIFAMVDTNTDPNLVDFAIPSNDDASKSIALIVNAMTMAVAEGLNERLAAREKQAIEEKEAEEEEEKKIEVKSETIEMAEDLDDEAAEKQKKDEPKLHKLREKEEGAAKPKKPKKALSKKG
jgi:small subunit ribosomal protein S2